ncbi:Ras association domain-containing protein 8 [Nymphon striatum]|nr:Ras association domain-containing protein 8 [Nymphon striatum]
MELKVWVDGIQRIVCGVSDTTTCQDVVYALAHATSQTGRFTLVEKWRNNERILAPSDKPVRVLLKWGEYSGDVQFMLRRSNSNTNDSQRRDTKDSSKTPYFSPQRLPSNGREGSKSPSDGSKEIKKSLTFSGGRSGASTPSDLLEAPSTPNNRIDVSSVQGSRSDPPLYKDHRSRNDLPKGVVRGVPQQKPYYNSSDVIANEKDPDPVILRSNKKIGPPPEYRIPPPCKPYSPNQKLSPDRSQYKNSSSPSDNGARTKSLVNNNSHPVSSPHVSIDIPVFKSSTTSLRENSTNNISYYPKEKSHDQTLPVSHNSNGKQAPSPPERTQASHDKFIKRSQRNDPQCSEILRILSMQREKISTLESELKQYDSEIKYWEETNRKHDHEAQVLERDIRRLEFSEKEQSEHLSKLDLKQIEIEFDVEKQQEKTLRNELSQLRSDFKNNEKEVIRLNENLQKLSKSFKDEKELLNKEKKDKEIHEKELLQQVEDFKENIEVDLSKYEEVSKSCDYIKDELVVIDDKLSNKKKEVEDLVCDMKVVNLESLTLGSSDDNKNEGFTHSRSGSTRKMVGSPRELENAVPTNKNPHGVWV